MQNAVGKRNPSRGEKIKTVSESNQRVFKLTIVTITIIIIVIIKHIL